jgi:hypothetical protein
MHRARAPAGPGQDRATHVKTRTRHSRRVFRRRTGAAWQLEARAGRGNRPAGGPGGGWWAAGGAASLATAAAAAPPAGRRDTRTQVEFGADAALQALAYPTRNLKFLAGAGGGDRRTRSRPSSRSSAALALRLRRRSAVHDNDAPVTAHPSPTRSPTLREAIIASALTLRMVPVPRPHSRRPPAIAGLRTLAGRAPDDLGLGRGAPSGRRAGPAAMPRPCTDCLL